MHVCKCVQDIMLGYYLFTGLIDSIYLIDLAELIVISRKIVRCGFVYFAHDRINDRIIVDERRIQVYHDAARNPGMFSCTAREAICHQKISIIIVKTAVDRIQSNKRNR